MLEYHMLLPYYGSCIPVLFVMTGSSLLFKDVLCLIVCGNLILKCMCRKSPMLNFRHVVHMKLVRD